MLGLNALPGSPQCFVGGGGNNISMFKWTRNDISCHQS